MPADRKPSSLDGIKRLAKSIKAASGVTHAVALNEAARRAGFENYAHARKALTRKKEPAVPTTTRRRGEPAGLAAFRERSRAAWTNALNTIDPEESHARTWTSRSAIIAVLEPFVGQNNNHALLPTGGGQDFTSVTRANDAGCIELRVGRSTGYVVKPKRLTMERIESDPGESFLLLELDELPPSGVYARDEDEDKEPDVPQGDRGKEELLELSPGEYVDRSIWDRGFLSYDDDGRERPLPRTARIVVRWFRGQILLVAKGSLWNGDSGTYDGRHNRMSANTIRRIIERSLEAAQGEQD